jgi:hypothetical protein
MPRTEENRFAVISEISVKNFRVFGVVSGSSHPVSRCVTSRISDWHFSHPMRRTNYFMGDFLK